MKAFPWICAGIGLGFAVYVLTQQPGSQRTTGDPDLDRAANKAGAWGTKERVTGTGGSLLGKAKEGIGNLTGDKSLEGEGLVDQAVGTIKDTAGQAAHAVSDAIHNANS